MNSMQQMVKKFHEKYSHQIGKNPSLLKENLLKFRIDFLQEELNEIKDASEKKDLVKIIHEICDLLYVTHGVCVCMGIDIQPFFEEVHRSNMSKDMPPGPISKPIKGKDYFLPDIKKILKQQLLSKKIKNKPLRKGYNSCGCKSNAYCPHQDGPRD